jgi:hypothetical protein
MRSRRLLILTALSVFISAPTDIATAQAVTVFKGRPMVKVSEGGTERVPETLPRDKAVNLEVVISKIGEDYYWASRENTEMCA